MKKCTETDKPLISILMAVYHPNRDWLAQQLDSLNAQTYPNLRLYVRDDGPDQPAEASVFSEQITAFPVFFSRNEKNIGSNLTFQKLTEEAEGTYFAYCDQDDIWFSEKLSVLQACIEAENARLVCSDMHIIDGNGRLLAKSATKVHKHWKFRSGEGLTDTLWHQNFVSGCALLVRSETAKRAIPFNPYVIYDQHIALWAANEGKVISVSRPLIAYREHGKNLSGSLHGVTDRESYLRERILKLKNSILWLWKNFPADEALREQLRKGLAWCCAREQYFGGDRTKARFLWENRRYSPKATLFELMLPYLPDFLFRLAIWVGQKNLI